MVRPVASADSGSGIGVAAGSISMASDANQEAEDTLDRDEHELQDAREHKHVQEREPERAHTFQGLAEIIREDAVQQPVPVQRWNREEVEEREGEVDDQRVEQDAEDGREDRALV